VMLATVAPELPGALPVIEELTGRGVVVSLGHTDASAEQFAAGLAAGATYVTHLFNAMRPFNHRDPGPIGCTLADESVVAGLICDGIHVDPVVVRMAWRALGPSRLNLITDAVDALGLDTGGTSRIGSVDVISGAAGVRTADGVLAGSNLALDQAVRNLVAFTGCPVVEAIATVTSTPAAVLQLPDRGRLSVGARGDVTVLDPVLAVMATVVGGELVWSS
jgi:N-acetylglucosamine-6-phosphate deacetylase